jgi:hypothetical protein
MSGIEKAKLNRQRGLRRRKETFLHAYARLGRINAAAEAANIARTDHYNWLLADADYRAQFEALKVQVIGALEDEAYRRAVEGVDKPMTVAGERVDVKEYDSGLLMFLLRGLKPEVYGNQKQSIEHSGPGGGPIKHEAIPYEAIDALIAKHGTDSE